MTIHIAGLGPGNARQLTAEVRDLLSSGMPVVLRTREHPAAREVDPGSRFESCDDLYSSGRSFEDVYGAIVERVLDRAMHGDVVYAVPGHPSIAEATVPVIVDRARAAGLAVAMYPGVSFIDAAFARLGLAPGSFQLCDALDLRVDTWKDALIAQVHSREVASALKLQLLDLYPAEHQVTVLRALGAADEHVRTVPLAEVDHAPLSYLDTLFVPALEPVEDVRRLDGIAAIVARLHAPGGCPWDREQTHESLRKHLLEETYEVLEAIDGADPAKLGEELGDLLLQVLMHAEVAAREGEFTLGDVTEHIARKLVRRHPHVFGDVVAEDAEAVHRNWEALKQAERPRESALDGVPADLPALAASQTMQGRARRLGFDWEGIDGPLDKLREEITEFAAAPDAAAREEEYGDILFVAAGIGARLGVDVEQALRRANTKFRRRFAALEELSRERALDLRELAEADILALWREARVRAGERL